MGNNIWILATMRTSRDVVVLISRIYNRPLNFLMSSLLAFTLRFNAYREFELLRHDQLYSLPLSSMMNSLGGEKGPKPTRVAA
jgi:hypothetical protein